MPRSKSLLALAHQAKRFKEREAREKMRRYWRENGFERNPKPRAKPSDFAYNPQDTIVDIIDQITNKQERKRNKVRRSRVSQVIEEIQVSEETKLAYYARSDNQPMTEDLREKLIQDAIRVQLSKIKTINGVNAQCITCRNKLKVCACEVNRIMDSGREFSN